jgi:hypothetical protein
VKFTHGYKQEVHCQRTPLNFEFLDRVNPLRGAMIKLLVGANKTALFDPYCIMSDN